MSQASNNRVLAVCAHPDDAEIVCAGTLALLKQAGFEIHIATMSLGDCGSQELEPAEITKLRRIEAESACQLLGAAYHFVGFRDFEIFNEDASNRKVTALIRDVNPAIVFTHPPSDYMSDHEATSLLVRNACFYGPAANYDTSMHSSRRKSDHVPHLYYAHPLEGIDWFGRPVSPGIYCDISAVFETKQKMLAKHESQRKWLREHHGLDEYLDAVRRWSELLAERASALAGRRIAYAEAFTQHRGHAYPQGDMLFDLLGDHVVAESGFSG